MKELHTLLAALLRYLRGNSLDELPDDYLTLDRDDLQTFSRNVRKVEFSDGEVIWIVRFALEDGCGDEEVTGFFNAEGELRDAVYRCDGVREFIVKDGVAFR